MDFDMQLALAIMAALFTLVGVWLGSLLTARRAHREWLRDRTAQAYSIVLEALFELDRWFKTELDDHMRGREVSKEIETERRARYSAAKDQLDRTLAREEWLLPDTVNEAFVEMRKVFNTRYESWFDDMDASGHAVVVARKRLIAVARKSLRRRGWV